MIRFILPLLIAVAAFGIFFKFSDPIFAEIDTLRARQSELNEGLSNARKLREVEQKLLDEYNAMAPQDLADLEKLVPDNVDNVRLIIDINNIAKPYGMTVRNVKIQTEAEDAGQAVTRDRNNIQKASVTLDFSVTSDYQSFQSFLNDLARSLRLADLEAVNFTAGLSNRYDYQVRIKTYWLK